MKKILLVTILLSTISVLAEEVNVNNTPSKTTKKYEINDGTEDLTGDKSTLRKTAEQNWKKCLPCMERRI